MISLQRIGKGFPIKGWLRPFLIRFLIALLAIGGATAFFVRQPYLLARDLVTTHTEQVAAARQEVMEAQEWIARLPSPADMTTGTIGPARSYRDQVTSASEGITPVDLVPPPPLTSLRLPISPRASTLIAAVNELSKDPELRRTYQEINGALDQIDQLLAYHAATMKALVNILEYNPAVDFRTFEPESEDTADRLQRAKEGLAKAEKELAESTGIYRDPSISGIQESIRTLQHERNLLEETGDTKRWIKVTEELQQKILTNRVAFWEKESPLIADRLSKATQPLPDIVKRWKDIGDSSRSP